MSEVSNIPQLRFPEFSGEWEDGKLGNYGNLINGLTYSPDNIVDEGLLVLRSSNVQNGQIYLNDNVYVNLDVDDTALTREDDILICVRNGSKRLIGKSTIINKNLPKSTHGAFMTVFRGESNKFISHWFHSSIYYKEVHKNLGATINSINGSNLKKFKTIFPAKSEQQKIASFLTAVDTKIEQLSKKQALLGSWKKGLMQQIFSQAIRFKADDGSAFPVWEEKNIVELAKTSIGLVTSMTPYYVDKGVPLIRNNDIFQNKIRKEKLIRLDYEFDQLNKNRRLFTNDIVTVHTGNIGASAVIDEELNGCQGFATLNTRIKNQNEISSSFLCWYYNSTRNIKYALSMATGDGRSNYNLKDFNKATIPVPSLPEQTKIAAFLTAADNKIEQVGKQFDESKQFKKALLQQMFV